MCNKLSLFPAGDKKSKQTKQLGSRVGKKEVGAQLNQCAEARALRTTLGKCASVHYTHTHTHTVLQGQATGEPKDCILRKLEKSTVSI